MQVTCPGTAGGEGLGCKPQMLTLFLKCHALHLGERCWPNLRPSPKQAFPGRLASSSLDHRRFRFRFS